MNTLTDDLYFDWQNASVNYRLALLMVKYFNDLYVDAIPEISESPDPILLCYNSTVQDNLFTFDAYPYAIFYNKQSAIEYLMSQNYLQNCNSDLVWTCPTDKHIISLTTLHSSAFKTQLEESV